MKIKVKEIPFEQAEKLPHRPHKKPQKQNTFLRNIVNMYASVDLKKVNFTFESEHLDSISKDEPCLYLMNHSCFTDLLIAFKLISPKPFNIICTQDGFVGKEWLLRALGCIPTRKFVNDPTLIRDILYTVRKLNSSILMYPEASYTFDGTATPLPESLGKCIKHLGISVVMIRTYGAFLRDPLYNNLQLRKTDISAKMSVIISKDEAKTLSTDDINNILKENFTFDNLRWQQKNGVRITEKFRADCLNRVLYKCPHCDVEGQMLGKGISITCQNCGKTYTLKEDGYLQCENGNGRFNHIPDWFAWERDCVREEIVSGKYELKTDVDIYMLKDFSCIYKVGSGTLIHNLDGFTLTGCGGRLQYRQKPTASYSLYSDYYWYEIGDMICIGDTKNTYYCFPKEKGDIVAKARLAAEELYKLHKSRNKHNHR